MWSLAFLFMVASSAAMVSVIGLVERRCPVRASSFSAVRLNLLYLVPYSLAQVILTPLVAGLTTMAVNAAGGGLIELPRSGLGLVVGVLAYTLVMDFAEFCFHYAQHKTPMLWALHSLHHSDRDMNASTTFRHFWAEGAIKSLSIYPLVGLLLHANASIVSVYAVISFYNYFCHMNLRCGLGRWSWLVNSPQYHRLHHSCRPEDRDKRFAALFPIFDVVFGLYEPPRKGDYPPTGLDDDSAESLMIAVGWPIRKRLRRWRVGRQVQ